MVALSVLDLMPVRASHSTGQAIATSMSLARLADACGYTRYWFAEHHNMNSVAATSPAIATALAASQTQQIAVGSGGVMLPNHTPLVVAEQFAMLEAAFPGRIDLGIGRAPGADPLTSWALRQGRGQNIDEFPSWVQQVIAFLGGTSVDLGGETYKVHATPAPITSPQVWLLGSSSYSARLAATLGLPYVFAHHFTGRGTSEALGLYRDAWSTQGQHPRAFITANVVIGHDADEAKQLCGPYLYAMACIHTGRKLSGLPTVEDAERLVAETFDPSLIKAIGESWVVGAPHQVAEQLFELADEYSVNEIMIHPVAGSYEADPATSSPTREYTINELAYLLGGTS